MSFVEYVKEGPLAIITLNRPEKLNAIHPPLARELAEIWRSFQNDSEAHVVILTGKGRAFSVGIDLGHREKTANSNAPGPAVLPLDLPELFLKRFKWGLPGVTKPVICAVNGMTMGFGLSIVVHTDLRVAAESATFASREIALALPCVNPRLATQGLPLAVLNEMVLTGDPISARRAYEIGLVNKVVPDSELMAEARALAGRLLKHSPMALSKAKLLNLKFAMPPNEAAEILGDQYYDQAFASYDHREAVRALLEKRPPKFKGE